MKRSLRLLFTPSFALGLTATHISPLVAMSTRLDDIATKSQSIVTISQEELNERLFGATIGGRARDVIKFLTVGANINAKNIYGDTPIHIAALLGHANIAAILLEDGADITMKNNNNQTVAEAAKEHGNDALANLLEKYAELQQEKTELK